VLVGEAKGPRGTSTKKKYQDQPPKAPKPQALPPKEHEIETDLAVSKRQAATSD
jgi:PAB1-binding protein PBP1